MGQNLVYTLLDTNFNIFLADDFTWAKKSAAIVNFVLQNDVDTVTEDQRRTSGQKPVHHELMLGKRTSIAAFILRNSIVKQSTSLKDIYTKNCANIMGFTALAPRV